MPTVAIRIPPIAGPNTRVRLSVAEFSAIAFVRLDRGTSSEMSDWRAQLI